MSKVRAHALLDDVKPEKFQQEASQVLAQLVDTVNGQLEFDQNFLSNTKEVVFTLANTEQAVNHNLNKLIYNYMPVSKLAACDIYDGGTSPTSNTIYLKSTVATTVTLILF